MNTLTSVLSTAPPLVLQTVLLWVLIRRQQFRMFRWFFAYTLFSVIATVARFLVAAHPNIYFDVYWATEVGYAILGVGVLYEVFWAVFRNLGYIWWFRWVFPLGIAFTVILAVVRSQMQPPQFSNRLMAWIVTSELALRLLQVSMFTVLVALVRFLGLRWRQYAFGIAAGFGLYATIALLATTKVSEFGTRFAFLWGVLSVAAYTIAVLVWLWFFSLPQQPGKPRNEEAPLSLRELERYKEITRKIRGR